MDILSLYKMKSVQIVKKFSAFVKGPVGEIRDKSTRTALLSIEEAKMEEELERAYNEALSDLQSNRIR